MANIPLETGDNPLHPRLCTCPRCGGDSNELAIGAIRKAETSKGWVYANKGQTTKVRMDLQKQGIYETLQWVALGENEKVPSSTICDSCKKELEEHKAVVAEGGIYFKCLKCNMAGVLRAESQLAIDVRLNTKIEAPNPVGVESTGCGEPDGLNFGEFCPLKKE